MHLHDLDGQFRPCACSLQLPLVHDPRYEWTPAARTSYKDQAAAAELLKRDYCLAGNANKLTHRRMPAAMVMSGEGYVIL